MAQTKKRAASKRSPSTGKSGTRKRSSSNKSTSKSRSTKSRSATKSSRPTPASRSSSDGSGRVDSIRHGVEDRAKSASQSAKSAGQTVGKAAGKAKVPLIAGSAALAGAAGGIALATRHDRHRRLTMAMRKPRIKLTSKDVARAAKEVGHISTQVGQLASELQRARESNGGDRHRSPVEVVLDGLTARR